MEDIKRNDVKDIIVDAAITFFIITLIIFFGGIAYICI